MSARIRQIRISILITMALKGKTEYQLLNKSRSWGVTETTAQGYVKSIKAMLKSKNLLK